MKKYLLPLTMLALAVGALQPLHASSQGETVSEKTKIVIKPELYLQVKRSKAEIVPGESQYQKQLKSKPRETRNLISRERVAIVESSPAPEYNLDELRNLYRSAASKFGIDWKLVEAVHQVETGKSSQCKKNPSGATGPMQFIPSTFRHYANEGDNICGLKDSVYAAANLLAKSGADEGDVDRALFNYNHSTSYVNLVKSIRDSI